MNGLLVGKPRLLERHADPLADLGLVGRPAQAEDLDVARGRLVQPLEDLDGRRLARAVGPEQPEALADWGSPGRVPLTASTGPLRPGYCLRRSLTRMAQSPISGTPPERHVGGAGSVRPHPPVARTSPPSRDSPTSTVSQIGDGRRQRQAGQITAPSGRTMNLGVTTICRGSRGWASPRRLDARPR